MVGANACSDGDELIDDGRPRCNDERGGCEVEEVTMQSNLGG